MINFREKLKESIGQEIFLKDVNGTAYGGILKEVGEDCCILAIAKRMLVYNLSHIVSVEGRMANPNDPASGKQPEIPVQPI